MYSYLVLSVGMGCPDSLMGIILKVFHWDVVGRYLSPAVLVDVSRCWRKSCVCVIARLERSNAGDKRCSSM